MNEQLTAMSKEVIQETLLLCNTGVDANDGRWSDLLTKITGQPSSKQLLEPIIVADFTCKDVLMAHLLMWPAFIFTFLDAKPEEFPKATFTHAVECYEKAVLHGGWLLSLADIQLAICSSHFISLKDDYDKDKMWGDQVIIDDLTLSQLLSGSNFVWSTLNRLGKTIIDLFVDGRAKSTSMVYTLKNGLAITTDTTIPICEYNNIHDKEINACFGHVVHVSILRFNQLKKMVESLKLINPIAQKIYSDAWKDIVMDIVRNGVGAREAYRALDFVRDKADELGTPIHSADPQKLAEDFQVMLENAEKLTIPKASVTRH